MNKTYSICRFIYDEPNELIKEGLTLEEAREWCNDPETSYKTCSSETQEKIGHELWFDGYESS